MSQKLCTRTFGQSTLPAMRLPGDDASGRDDRVERLSAAAAFVGEDELRRRRLHLVRAQRPLRIVEVELRVDVAEIHVRFVVGVERADVAPVLGVLLVLVGEPVGVDRHARDQRRDDVLAEIVRRRPARVVLERGHEHAHVEDVDAHRREHLAAARRGASASRESRSADPASSTCRTPNRFASSDGISITASVAPAPRSCGSAASSRSPSCRRDPRTARSAACGFSRRIE